MSAFIRSAPGAYDPATDTSGPPVVTSVDGAAIEVAGDPDQYRAAGLELDRAPTLFFTPTEYGLRAHTPDFVLPGDTIVWNDTVFMAKAIHVIAPDGIVIAGRIIVVA